MNRRSFWLPALIMAILMAVPALNLIDFSDDSMVAADESPVADSQGYTWLDNKQPNPMTTWNWVDCQNGTEVAFSNYYSYYEIYYYEYKEITLPFAFNFYGVDYTKAYVTPHGVMGFTDDSYLNYYYNSYDLPSDYAYAPDNIVSPYWGYSAIPADRDTSGVFYQSGSDSEGNYIAIEWHDAKIYCFQQISSSYYDNYDITYEVLLYENGNIKFQYFDTSTDYSGYSDGDYVTVGIENADGSIGLQYSRDSPGSITPGLAIVFKQFKTEIQKVEFIDGYGPDGRAYPAQGGAGEHDYWARAYLWSEKGIDSLTDLNMVIGAKTSGENIVINYNFIDGKFRKYNDGMRQVAFDDKAGSIFYYNSSDMTHYIGVEFRFDFNLWWSRHDLVSVAFEVEGTGIKGASRMYDDVFYVETRILMAGNLSITSSSGRQINKGDWVKGGDTLHFSGIHREYQGVGPQLTPPDNMQIIMEDQNAIQYKPEGPDLDVDVYVSPDYPTMVYRLVMLNVSVGNDVTPIELTASINIRVDSDSPGLPGDLMIYPDSPDDLPRNFDNDREVFFTWTDAVDPSSGVVKYHISVNRPKSTNPETYEVSKGTLSQTIKDLPEGNNKIYIWAEDAVGNLGAEIFTNVKIDMTHVTFADFYPKSGIWLTNLRPTCSIWINDTDTGVDPLSLEYQISTTGEINLVDQWQQVQETYAADNSLRVVVVGWFRNGLENWIQFRAKDVAGNGYAESDAYNVWIDAEGPKYKLSAPTGDYQPTPTMDVKIRITDEESGVDASTIEYRYTTRGTAKFTPWKPYKDAENGASVLVTIRETFSRGDQNFIQVRSRDLAGNPISSSPIYQIKVNTYPVIVVSSPSPGDIYLDTEKIIFDATLTYDPDGRIPTVNWYRSTDEGPELFGESAYVEAKDFDEGEHTITVVAKDEMNNEVAYHFKIRVEKYIPPPPENLDTDQDGMDDAWEILYGTDPLNKDAEKDYDNDDFTNLMEYDNHTDPQNFYSHPEVALETDDDEPKNIFEQWILWALIAVLLIVIIVTMLVTKTKKDRAVKRIKTVHNMKRIMPSVSWEQITAATYMAPGAALPGMAQVSGPALPSAAPTEVAPETALPPAPEQAQAQAPETAPAQAQEAAPAPQAQPAQPQYAPPQPAAAPQPEAAPAPAPAPAPAQPAYQTPQAYDPNAPQQ